MNLLWRNRCYSGSNLRDKGFATTVLTTLLACIAANTLTFAVVNSVLLRPLPLPKADSIVAASLLLPVLAAAGIDTMPRAGEVPASACSWGCFRFPIFSLPV